MTNEEAIDELSVIYERLSHPYDCSKGVYSFSDGYYLEALDVAIKALEQKAVLDKIEDEINSSNRGTCDYFIVDRIEEIINKYKAESEDKE